MNKRLIQKPTKSLRKALGVGLIDALLAFLFLSPALFLYAKTQVSQRVNLINSNEINQAVSLAENIRLTLIAHGREVLLTQPAITDAQFSSEVGNFAVNLSQQYQALRSQQPCRPEEPMMGWTGSLCANNPFRLALRPEPFSTSEKGQPIAISITWADQTGNQNYSVRTLVGKY